MLASLLINLVILAVLALLSMATAGIWLSIDVLALAALLPGTLLGVMGLGFIEAGLTIVYKQVNAMLQLHQLVLMDIAFAPLPLRPLLQPAPRGRGHELVRRVVT